MNKNKLIIVIIFIFFESLSYFALNNYQNVFFQAQKSHIAETSVRNNFFKFSGKSRPTHPTLDWKAYRLPPVRLMPTSSNQQKDNVLLVNKFRRVKLNNNPADSEALDPRAYLVVITGNSTCAGYGASQNSSTIAAVLQRLLRARYGLQIQVLNYCVPDNKFSDEIMQFVFNLNFLKPKIWISFNGDNDASISRVSLPPEVKYLVGRKIFNTISDYNNQVLAFSNIYKLIDTMLRRKKVQAIERDLINSAEISTNTTDEIIYTNALRNAIALASINNIDFIHVLQPIMGLDKHNLSEQEQAQKQSAVNSQGLKDAMSTLSSAKSFYTNIKNDLINLEKKSRSLAYRYKYYNFDDVFADVGQSVYSDPRHYNDLGQELVAARLFKILIPLIKVKPLIKFSR